jgi:general secretion pathway protein H
MMRLLEQNKPAFERINNQRSFTSRQAAFSLLEILIAMAIMALMVAIAFPNLGQNPDKLAKKETLRLVAAIEMVRDRSIILNQEYGLNIDEDGYQFLVLFEDDSDENEPSKWRFVDDIPELGEHKFPEGLEINVTIDGDNLFTSQEDDVDIFEEDVDIFEGDEEEKEIEPPQVYFLSTGEQNQFSVGIAADEEQQRDRDERTFFRVRGFLTGNLKYEGPLNGNLFQDLDRNFEEDDFQTGFDNDR